MLPPFMARYMKKPSRLPNDCPFNRETGLHLMAHCTRLPLASVHCQQNVIRIPGTSRSRCVHPPTTVPMAITPACTDDDVPSYVHPAVAGSNAKPLAPQHPLCLVSMPCHTCSIQTSLPEPAAVSYLPGADLCTDSIKL